MKDLRSKTMYPMLGLTANKKANISKMSLISGASTIFNDIITILQLENPIHSNYKLTDIKD